MNKQIAGDSSPQDTVGTALRRGRMARPRRPKRMEQVSRALILDTGVAQGRAGQAFKAKPIRLPKGATVLEAFRLIAAACIRQFLLNRAAFNQARRPETVHQMRVAIRRLRSLVSFHRRLLRSGERDLLRLKLRQVFVALGRARELDVLLEHVAADAVSGDVAHLEAARQAAYQEVAELLASPALLRGVLALQLWFARRPLSETGEPEPLPAHAMAILRRQSRKLRRFDRVALLATEEMHRLRIEAKKFRYACDFFESAFPDHRKRRRKLAAALERLQEVLGDFNDLHVTGLLSARLSREFGGGDATAALPDERRTGRLRKASAKALRQVLAVRPFWKAA